MTGLAVRHEAASAALVRHAISADLESLAVTADDIDDVLLVASELVGNAVTHTRGHDGADIDVSWDVEPAPGRQDGRATVLLGVTDGSTAQPTARSWTTTENCGRGLAIVATIAADWGVQPTGTGKRVWARVPVATAS